MVRLNNGHAMPLGQVLEKERLEETRLPGAGTTPNGGMITLLGGTKAKHGTSERGETVTKNNVMASREEIAETHSPLRSTPAVPTADAWVVHRGQRLHNRLLCWLVSSLDIVRVLRKR